MTSTNGNTPKAARVAQLLTGSNLSSADLVQNPFLRVAHRFVSLDAPVAYLRTAVVNDAGLIR